jgi:hypothetical protein
MPNEGSDDIGLEKAVYVSINGATKDEVEAIEACLIACVPDGFAVRVAKQL